MTPSLMDKLRMMDADQAAQMAQASQTAQTQAEVAQASQTTQFQTASGEPDEATGGLFAQRQKEPVPSKEAVPQKEVSCYHRKDTFPLALFGDRSHATPAILADIFGFAFPRHVSPEDFLFLDTETTGLSGGVGTLAFQVGLGYFEKHEFVVEQFLMRDYDEESFMLREVSALCARFPILVSFNGRSFDVPLLKARMLMNRQRDDGIPALHADALFPSRRLWKLRLGSCRLANLEEALLGVSREDDLPGALVPQAYFAYLRSRDFGPIDRILTHNRQDIVSLAQLSFFLCKEYSRPEEIGYQQDLLSMARAHEKEGRKQQAVKCYRLCAHGATRPEAFQALALHEKRQGKADNAIRLYTAMLRRGDDPVQACQALAKLYEHGKRDIEKALHYTRQGLLLLSEPSLSLDGAVQEQRNALQYRYARLRRKQG